MLAPFLSIVPNAGLSFESQTKLSAAGLGRSEADVYRSDTRGKRRVGWDLLDQPVPAHTACSSNENTVEF